MANFWDRPGIFSANVSGQSEGEQERQALQARFQRFLTDYIVEETHIYMDQIRKQRNLRQYWVNIDLGDLAKWDSELASTVVNKPDFCLGILESLVTSLAQQDAQGLNARTSYGTESSLDHLDAGAEHFQVTLSSRDSNWFTPIRQISSSHVSKLIRVPGIVISASSTHAKATSITVVCRGCGHKKEIAIRPGFSGAQLPKACDNQARRKEDGACPPDPYVIQADRCRFVDQQTLKLQESPETIPTGEMPRHVLLTCDRSLVSTAVPGTRVTAIGVCSVFSGGGGGGRGDRSGDSRGRAGVAVMKPYLRLVGLQIDVDGAGRSSGLFKPEEEAEFIEMSRQPDIYDAIANSIAPAIFGHSDIKRAIACLLFGGSRKLLPDGMKLRGDINVLLLGDPGTAKSQFLKFVEKVAPIGVYTSGKGSSAAGLTASVIKDHGGEFYLEGGAMVLADGGVVCIDEFDKMHVGDRVAIHEAMEQQTISIAKAGITTILNSRTSVLAAANLVFGSYNDMRSPLDNIDFQSTILSRFDMIFIVKDHKDAKRDQQIARHVLNVHINAKTEPIEPEIPTHKLKRYISYCRARCAPRLSQSAHEVLKNHYVKIRSSLRERTMEGDTPAIPITVRQLEAIVRISEALAKMSLSPQATEDHIKEAIRLFKVSTLEAANAGVNVTENVSPQAMKEVALAEGKIKKRLPVGLRCSEQELIQSFVRQGMSEFAVRKAIAVMVQREELEYRNQRRQLYRKR